MASASSIVRRAACGLPFLLALASAPATSHAFTGSSGFSGRVVDAVTGEPIAAAVVLASWTVRRREFDFFAVPSNVKILEAVTDAEGRYAIPAWVGLASGRVDGSVHFFKDEYKAEVRSMANDIGWRPTVERVALGPSASNPAQSSRSMQFLVSHLRKLTSDLDFICEWQHFPETLRAVERAEARLWRLGGDEGGWVDRFRQTRQVQACPTSIDDVLGSPVRSPVVR
jgi:hypothetical protein